MHTYRKSERLLSFMQLLLYAAMTFLFSSCGGGSGSGSTASGGNATEIGNGSLLISGSVVLNGRGVEGITVELSGNATGSTTTDSHGLYAFTKVGKGTYTMKPVGAGFTFSPANKTVTVDADSMRGQNFLATAVSAGGGGGGSQVGPGGFFISGGIVLNGKPLPGITVNLSGDAAGSTTTDSHGLYSFTGVAKGTYTVTPVDTGFNFSPASKTVTVEDKSVRGQNFLATPISAGGGGGGSQVGPGGFFISGGIVLNGKPLPGITVNLSGDAAGSTTTDSHGLYSFTGVAKGTYTVTPADTGFTFSPSSKTVTVDAASVRGQNFLATAVSAGGGGGGGSEVGPGSFFISGGIVVNGKPLSGITVNLSGDAIGSTKTDSHGLYSFTGVAKGTYIVKPVDTGFTFSPSSKTVTVDAASVRGQNFLATAVSAGGGGGGGSEVGPGSFFISGGIVLNGKPLSGITVNLSGDATGTTTTDLNGLYSFTGVVKGSYIVAPADTGFTFAPANRALTVDADNVRGQNFLATAVSAGGGGGGGSEVGPGSFFISGGVVMNGVGVEGVTVELSGDASGSTTTDSHGLYAFTGVANGDYTVAPADTGFTFSPVSKTVVVDADNVRGQNFLATAVSAGGGGGGGSEVGPGSLFISGGIVVNGKPLSGITVNLSGGASGSTTTDSHGLYAFTGVANGDYTVTPADTGFTFSPASRDVKVVDSNVRGQNFLATPH